MGYHLNRLDEPVFMVVPEPMLSEFGIHQRLESCAYINKVLSCAQEFLPLILACWQVMEDRKMAAKSRTVLLKQSCFFFQLFWLNSRRNKLKVFAKLKDF